MTTIQPTGNIVLAIVMIALSLIGVNVLREDRVDAAVDPGCYIRQYESTEVREVGCPSDSETQERVANGGCYYGEGRAPDTGPVALTERDCSSINLTGPADSEFADGCGSSGTFFGLPQWHKYLQNKEQVNDPLTGGTSCNIKINGLNDIWLVGAAILEILLRVAALVAVGFIIYAGVLYIISQSQPDKVSMALKTAINAVIGLTISIAAAALVSFIAGRF